MSAESAAAALNELQARAGVRFFDYQAQALAAAMAQPGPQQRRCLYYKTGAGKSLTALAMVALWGHSAAVVVAPPSTHLAWETLGAKLGVEVEAMSHAKFRMKDTKLSRSKAIIADEFHMFGGHAGQGWKKLDALARYLQAPLVLASATPNYNDAERVYCIKHILDPMGTRGGYLAFLHQHCRTRHNPYSTTPTVDEDRPFLHHRDAAEFLASLPNVDYLPDDLVYTIEDLTYDEDIATELDVFGYDRRNHRIIASQMEERHTRRFQGLVGTDGFIHDHVYEILADLAGQATTPLLVYADHATVADALGRILEAKGVQHAVVTGGVSKLVKEVTIDRFRQGRLDVLVGTASLATGTDGLDKVCNTLVILDDTADDALRRQLIGRIMPRGADADATMKQVFRLLPV